MNMCSVLAILAAAACLAGARAELPDDQELIARAAAERRPAPQPPAQQPTESQDSSYDLNRLERRARVDLTVAQTRLELILARKALRSGRHADAARQALRVLQLLGESPADLDAGVYELQAEGILAKAGRAGVDVAALRSEPSPASAPRFPRHPADRARTARDIARGHRPTKPIIDTQAIPERDRRRLHYQDALNAAYKSDEVRLLIEADEARIVPQSDVSYPDDWPAKRARREKYAAGVIARSPSWVDKEGREWYVAIYDIHDLIHVLPDFSWPFGFSPVESARIAEDRAALRRYSEIFGGYPEDLAAGIPLLRYFGGIDEFAFRGPKYSLERQRQIVKMIEAFTSQSTEARVEAIAP